VSALRQKESWSVLVGGTESRPKNGSAVIRLAAPQMKG
jgi:hypothetical protein